VPSSVFRSWSVLIDCSSTFTYIWLISFSHSISSIAYYSCDFAASNSCWSYSIYSFNSASYSYHLLGSCCSF